MSETRDLVFFYNGVEAADETILNLPVDLPLPEKGGLMRRGGRVWKVVEVIKTNPSSTTARNVVYRVFLSDEYDSGPTPPSTRVS